MIKLSIITINFNNLSGLQRTMQSVFAQNFTDYEYIIIDGGSTDGSKEYIDQQTDKINYWVSEKDNGIYNAMNKGIAKANGEYLLFLNSGDHFYSPDSLTSVFKSFQNEEIVYGNLLVTEVNGKQWVYEFPDKLSFGYFYQASLPHQATFIKRELFDRIGLYNESLRVASDWEFFIKAICINNCTYKHVPESVSMFYMGGISTNEEFEGLTSGERKDTLINNYSSFFYEYKEYFEMKSQLNNYKNSRAHQLVEKIISSSLYKKFKK